MKRPALIRELSTVTILACALLGVPALACQNPALSAPGVASTLDLSDRPWPDAPVADAAVADYLPVTGDTAASVIGMWHAVFRLGDASGPVYDEVFEQFHSDGTELIISSGLPPALGNVCCWRVAARGGAHLQAPPYDVELGAAGQWFRRAGHLCWAFRARGDVAPRRARAALQRHVLGSEFRHRRRANTSRASTRRAS